MNATSNTTSDMDTNNNPWVESGAMVYVAITVATMSAVIMCCTWFITHNTALQRWWHGKAQYGNIDGEEEDTCRTRVLLRKRRRRRQSCTF